MSQTQVPPFPAVMPHGGATTEERPRYRRRHWWIDPAMQGRYFLNLLFISALVGTAVALLTAHVCLYWGGHAALDAPLLKARLLRVALEATVLAIVVLPAVGVFMSHRFAGPAYRLRKSAEAVAEGKVDFRIKLRRYDHLKPVAASFNRMLERLEERERIAGNTRTLATESIREAIRKISTEDESALPEILRLLEEAEANLR